MNGTPNAYEYILPIIVSFISDNYENLYFASFLALKLHFSSEMSGKILSFTHAILVLIIATIVPDGSRKTFGYMICLMCIKYWASDLIYGFKRLKNDIKLHHVTCIIIVGYFTYIDMYIEYMLLFMVVEISTVFLHLAWFLKKFGLENDNVYKINGGLLWLSFLLCRVLYLPYIAYMFILNTGKIYGAPEITFLTTTYLLWVLSTLWMYKISIIIFRKVKKK